MPGRGCCCTGRPRPDERRDVVAAVAETTVPCRVVRWGRSPPEPHKFLWEPSQAKALCPDTGSSWPAAGGVPLSAVPWPGCACCIAESGSGGSPCWSTMQEPGEARPDSLPARQQPGTTCRVSSYQACHALPCPEDLPLNVVSSLKQARLYVRALIRPSLFQDERGPNPLLNEEQGSRQPWGQEEKKDQERTAHSKAL